MNAVAERRIARWSRGAVALAAAGIVMLAACGETARSDARGAGTRASEIPTERPTDDGDGLAQDDAASLPGASDAEGQARDTRAVGEDSPVTEGSTVDVPGVAEPVAEAADAVVPGADGPVTEGSTVDVPAADEPRVQEPRAEDARAQEPGPEVSVAVVPGAEEPGAARPGAAQPGTDERGPGTVDSAPAKAPPPTHESPAEPTPEDEKSSGSSASPARTTAGSVFPPFDEDGGVASWTVEIVEIVPHDTGAFTQGLEVAGGAMYESTGLWGSSSIRIVDPDTGKVLLREALADEYFGEGLTVVGDTVVQITWQSGTAFVYDRFTLQPLGEHRYGGEGWGLCLMGDSLIMSDGSDMLTLRDPATFEAAGSVKVTAGNYRGSLDRLNELECVDGMVIANVWQTEHLLVIDPVSGDVAASIDAAALIADAAAASGGERMDVLNGVAAAHDNTLWMTGKLWPRLYRVRIVESS